MTCKIILIIPDVVELNQTFALEKMENSFLRKHSIVFLYSEYGMLYESGAKHLKNVTDKLMNHGTIFETRKKLDGKVLSLVQMDDPPRSMVIGGRVTGLDGLFLDGYVKFMNTSYVVKEHLRRRFRLTEFKNLLNMNDVLIFNMIDFVSWIEDYASMFYMFKFTHKCVLVPKQPPVNLIEQFLGIMQPSLVIFLLVMFIVFGIAIYLVLTLRPALKLNICEIYFTLFQIAITNSVSVSKMRTLFERFALFACIVVCFLIVSGVQSLLKQFLVVPMSNEIDTLEQLNDSNLKILTTPYSKSLFVENFDATFANKVVDAGYPTIDMINRSYAFLLNEYDVDHFYYSSANFPDGVQQMHKMKQCLEKNYRGYVGPKDSNYMESMHFYLQAIEESGIRQHWEQQRANEDDFKRRNVGEKVTITFDHIKKVFNLLLIGYSAAAVAFSVEVIVGRVKQWRSQ
jgi:hypothetical protein